MILERLARLNLPKRFGSLASKSKVAVSDLADGTDGQIITWDASGNPATVAVGTATHVLTSNGADAAPTFQAAAQVLIEAQDISSGQATVDFESNIDSTYDDYLLIISGCTIVEDDQHLTIVIGTGETPTYQTGSVYNWAVGAAVAGGASVSTNASDTSICITHQDAGQALGNAANESFSGTIYMHRPADAVFTEFTFNCGYFRAVDGAYVATHGGGAYVATTAVTALRIIAEGGNIDGGKFALYGIKS